MKIHPVGAEFFLTDRRTDMTMLRIVFAILRTRLKKNVHTTVHFPELQ